MTISSDGILFFGIELGDDYDNEWPWEQVGDEEEWEAFVAEKLGVKKPDVPYEGNEAVHSAYWDAKRDIIKPLDCEIGLHCSYDHGMLYVALKSKNLTASRGSPQVVTEDFMKITSEDIQKLKEFCKLAEIEWQEPKWYLTSLYG